MDQWRRQGPSVGNVAAGILEWSRTNGFEPHFTDGGQATLRLRKGETTWNPVQLWNYRWRVALKFDRPWPAPFTGEAGQVQVLKLFNSAGFRFPLKKKTYPTVPAVDLLDSAWLQKFLAILQRMLRDIQAAVSTQPPVTTP